MRGAVSNYLRRHDLRQIRLKAVLVDMDGVLFDSMPLHAKAWVQAARDFSLAMTEHDAFLHEGRTGRSTIDILMQRQYGRRATDREAADLYAAKCRYFNLLPAAPVMPGALEFLNQVKAIGLQIVLVTGSGQHSLLDHLNHYFPDIFRADLAVTSFDVREGKPAPEPYLMGLSKGGVHSGEALAVENAPLGVRSAVSANIFTVAVNTGPLRDDELLSEHPDLLLHSMSELSDRWAALREALARTTI